jgi:hypothetical protein
MRETAPPERVFGAFTDRMSYARSSYSASRQNQGMNLYRSSTALPSPMRIELRRKEKR